MQNLERELMRPAVAVVRRLGDAVEEQNARLRELGEVHEELHRKLAVEKLVRETR